MEAIKLTKSQKSNAKKNATIKRFKSESSEIGQNFVNKKRPSDLRREAQRRKKRLQEKGYIVRKRSFSTSEIKNTTHAL